ncbi:ABC transporter ATP-binding protein [Vagococcus sp. PNs007]|uniref:ABC transporter ATP-binding protein n=1 Tax=Vagococcus proximus TaxID=2991417 RepID=A0ABT5X1K1_9ENTE|nr:ABC transporter ATP-binding protein [Vagococcus proximus]MDF0479881.1 ABC transporter ATP-binding protein [Vagococcus proximus]
MYQLKNVTKKYDEKVVLEDVNYTAPTSGLLCVMGESGSGKSTLLSLIAGLDRDYVGDIQLAGQSLHELSDKALTQYRKDYIGFIFQEYHLLEGYTALENVVYPGALKEQTQSAELKALALLEEVGLSDKASSKVEALSGGQKQRVAIARALLNEPEVIIADEPTGALDHETMTGIMTVLQEIAKTRLVILITHDPEVCEYADEVLTIQENKLIVARAMDKTVQHHKRSFGLTPYPKVPTAKLAAKEVKVGLGHYLLLALCFAIASTCIMLALSAGGVVDNSIAEFKDKNEALANGYLNKKNGATDKVISELKKDPRLDTVYKQYILKNLTLESQGKTVKLAEKYPMAKSNESFSYGRMPKKGKNEVALSGTLAKQFAPKINELIGETVKLTVNKQTKSYQVSGIYNAGYDDIYLSSDREQAYYDSLKNEKWYSVTFDVTEFDSLPKVYKDLTAKKLKPEMAVEEVTAMLASFAKLKSLFLVITGLVLLVCLFLVSVMMIKLQTTRKKTLSILAALGFNRALLSRLIDWENSILTLGTVVLTTISLTACYGISQWLNIPLGLSLTKLMSVIAVTAGAVLIISWVMKKVPKQAQLLMDLRE